MSRALIYHTDRNGPSAQDRAWADHLEREHRIGWRAAWAWKGETEPCAVVVASEPRILVAYEGRAETIDASLRPGADDLEDRTVPELREVARELGVSYSGLRKADLISAIRDHQVFAADVLNRV